jgi:chloride channel protein, CIC family
VLLADEDLEQARRQLVLYGRDGLPVLSHDGTLRGWLTRADLLRALTDTLASSEAQIEDGTIAADWAAGDPIAASHRPTRPLDGYELLELRVLAGSPALGKRIAEVRWPAATTVVAITEGREVRAARPDISLRAGERVLVLVPTPNGRRAPSAQSPAEPREQG